MKLVVRALRPLALLAALLGGLPSPGLAQGVTTGSLTGLVADQGGQAVAGANVIAIHLPSGSTYEATTRADGRFSIPAMRVGGPYSVTVAYGGTGAAAFSPVTQENVTVNLGVSSDLTFTTQAISVTETVTVSGVVDPVFSSTRTGAATSVDRSEIAAHPDAQRTAQRRDPPHAAGEQQRRSPATTTG